MDNDKTPEVGDRVTWPARPGYGPGTILEVGDGLTANLVQFDLHPTPCCVYADDLEADAELPDAKTALAKALEFKRQRDEALKGLWEVADKVAVAGIERVRAEVKLAEARREVEAYQALAASRKQAADHARAILRTIDGDHGSELYDSATYWLRTY